MSRILNRLQLIDVQIVDHDGSPFLVESTGTLENYLIRSIFEDNDEESTPVELEGFAPVEAAVQQRPGPASEPRPLRRARSTRPDERRRRGAPRLG